MSGQMVASIDTASIGVVHDVQLDYYGKRAAIATAEGTIHVFDIADGQQLPSGQCRGHEGPAWKVCWAHPKFGSVLASCSYDMRVIIWKEVSPSNWQIAYMDTSHVASVNSVQFCSWEHGLRLACASSDGTVSVLSYGSDHQWRRAAFNAHPAGAQTVGWAPVHQKNPDSPPPLRLATGGCDNAVHVWKCEAEVWSQESPAIPSAHTDWVRDVAWRPDTPSVLATGSWDKTVAIWSQEVEGQPWRQLAKLQLAGKAEGLSWSVTGSILAVSFGEAETSLYKESYDGRWEEVGKVNEPGFADVPNSITAAPAGGLGAGLAAAAVPGDEMAAQQQAVLAAFGPSA